MSKFKPNQSQTLTASQRPVLPAARNGPNGAYIGTAVPSRQTDAKTADENVLSDPGFRFGALNTTRKLALNCTLAFIFFRFSFLHEFVASKYGIDTHVLLIFGALSLLASLLSGLCFVGLKYRSVLMWILFVLCMCLATAFSSWLGGSVNVLIPYLRTTLPLVLLIPAVAYTAKDIQKVLDTIGIAGAASIIIGLVSNDFRSGRLELQTTGGTIQNANDFAAHMLLVLPAVAYCAMRVGRNPFIKFIGLGVMALGFYELLGTGSRGALVAVIVTGIFILVKGSAKLRIGLILGIPLLCGFVLPFVPGEAAQRLASLFNSSDVTEEAAESQASRMALLEDSLSITFHHPLLGIGPGEFEDYQGGLAAAAGQRGMWHETHNGYTQISSECGLPAFAFYFTAMVITFRSLRRAAKANAAFIAPFARTLSVMMVGFSVCLFFLSQGYSFSLLVITGLSVSIERLLQNDNSAADQSSSAA